MALKYLTTLIAGAALIAAFVTAAPASAGPGGDKLFKLALGVGALALVANAANSKDRAPAYSTQSRNWNLVHDRREPVFRHRQRYDMPRTCLYKHWTRRGWETVVSRSCVKKYAKRNHISVRDIRPRYRDRQGRIVWLDRDHGWIR